VRGEDDDTRANEPIGLVGLLMYGWAFAHSAAHHPNPTERDWAREEFAWRVPPRARGDPRRVITERRRTTPLRTCTGGAVLSSKLSDGSPASASG
jgi:hypothetical protein